ncbi:outer membrane protein assembly factor BamD [Tunicatimonas pelagia]|uniref:outer membrane protein assembly factor BamD n=1 Tax=Tunicatimonas pelagia TaxID=931531 RepID=UPI00266630D3|nr:outer membrane protein assembly factor BamD [Tunicatimonas pelagia]WKN42296.1 outer membrane protein assembly factor BamD [Tunicatimonas pelagia]
MKQYITVFLFLSTISFGCSDYRALLKKGSWEEQYEAALKYYEEKDYYRATVLLENVLPIIRGTQKSEDAQFYYAYAHYYERKYILSAHYFKEFYETYSRSEKAQEAMFMHAYSLYLESPNPSLEQSSTKEAIDAMQRFINRHPYSDYKERAEAILDDLQEKLEIKAFANAKQYFDLRRHEAAIIALDNFQKDYPDSDLNEAASYYKLAAQYQLAEQSVITKQRDRYYTTIEFYQNFIDKYPQSRFIGQAESIYESCLGKVQKENNNS